MFRESENAQGFPASATRAALESFIPNITLEELLRAAANPALKEDLALSLLQRADLPVEALECLAKNGNVLKMRKVKFALAGHPHTPRRISVPLIRQFYTFDLMKLSLTPGVPADVKVAADDALISRLKTVTLGERLALARRGSGRIAGAMLLDSDAKVMFAGSCFTEIFRFRRFCVRGKMVSCRRRDIPSGLSAEFALRLRTEYLCWRGRSNSVKGCPRCCATCCTVAPADADQRAVYARTSARASPEPLTHGKVNLVTLPVPTRVPGLLEILLLLRSPAR
jgi:hypothetical protein